MRFLTKTQKEKIIKFLKDRENPDGGFGMALIIPPDLEDTFYALQALRELGVNSVSKKTKKYILKTADAGPTDSFRVSYHMARLFKDYKLGKLPKAWLAQPAPSPQRIVEFYYSALFAGLTGLKIQLQPEVVDYLVAQTPRSLKFLPQVSRYVLLMDYLGLAIDKAAFADWIQQLQSFDGGFGPVYGSTAFLEYSYQALLALRVLGAKPLAAKKCRDFVMRCYISDGGFGRQSRTVPAPQYTYYAIKSLKILQSMI